MQRISSKPKRNHRQSSVTASAPRSRERASTGKTSSSKTVGLRSSTPKCQLLQSAHTTSTNRSTSAKCTAAQHTEPPGVVQLSKFSERYSKPKTILTNGDAQALDSFQTSMALIIDSNTYHIKGKIINKIIIRNQIYIKLNKYCQANK